MLRYNIYSDLQISQDQISSLGIARPKISNRNEVDNGETLKHCKYRNNLLRLSSRPIDRYPHDEINWRVKVI